MCVFVHRVKWCNMYLTMAHSFTQTSPLLSAAAIPAMLGKVFFYVTGAYVFIYKHIAALSKFIQTRSNLARPSRYRPSPYKYHKPYCQCPLPENVADGVFVKPLFWCTCWETGEAHFGRSCSCFETNGRVIKVNSADGRCDRWDRPVYAKPLKMNGSDLECIHSTRCLFLASEDGRLPPEIPTPCVSRA